MFIAHLPSGYLLAKSTLTKFKISQIAPSTVILTMMIGAIFPDIDLFYFFLIDHQQVHHHQYFLHRPILWIGLFLGLSLLYKFCQKTSKFLLLALLFCAGGILHVILDSLVGDIWWFAPFIDQAFALFKVEAQYQPWWLNFILHWSFWVEIFICIIAGIVYLRSKRTDTQ